MSWNDLSDDIKKEIILFTGGFKLNHFQSFKKPIEGIKMCSSIKVCYVCGLSSVWLRKSLRRNPSTRLYIKNDGNEIVEIFGKCKTHIDSVPTYSLLIPIEIETETDIINYVQNNFKNAKQIFLFNTEECLRSGWKIINITERIRSSSSLQ